MAENLDILNPAVSLLIRAVLLAAQLSGRVRKRSLKRLAAKDTDAKANLSWGRIRIANQLKLLGIFLTAYHLQNAA